MKKLFPILFLILPAMVYAQRDKLVCGNVLIGHGPMISARQPIKTDTVIDGKTILVYPFFYKSETYLVLADHVPDGSYNAYYADKTSLAFTVTYVNRKPEGIINSYYKDGSLRATRINHKGKPVGPFTSYHRNGKPSKSGTFKNGKLDSLYYEYWETGSVKSVANYDEGNQVGAYTAYYQSGEKKTEGMYVKNKKEGEWKIYSEDGQLEVKENYKKGKLISE